MIDHSYRPSVNSKIPANATTAIMAAFLGLTVVVLEIVSWYIVASIHTTEDSAVTKKQIINKASGCPNSHM